jgi:hypothetical protein
MIRKEKSSNPRDVVTELVRIKDKADLDIDKEHDNLMINNYMQFIKETLNFYENSRSKLISYKTRRQMTYNLIMILPIISKYAEIAFDYDITSKVPNIPEDRDVMRLLKEAYNSYSEENPEAINDIILCTLWLNDNK